MSDRVGLEKKIVDILYDTDAEPHHIEAIVELITHRETEIGKRVEDSISTDFGGRRQIKNREIVQLLKLFR